MHIFSGDLKKKHNDIISSKIKLKHNTKIINNELMQYIFGMSCFEVTPSGVCETI